MALGDINLPFVWQTWHLKAPTSILCGRRCIWKHRRAICGRRHLKASTSILCGRRGTWQHRPSLCVAGVLLWHWAGSGGARLIPVCVAALCAASVAIRSIDLQSVWQACHIHLHPVWQASYLASSTFSLCGRCAVFA